jgi:predicted ATPase
MEALNGLMRGSASESVHRLMKMFAPTWYSELMPHAANPEETAETGAAVERTPVRMKRELFILFRELGKLRPVVLFVDDFHWADVSTVDLISYLVTESERLLILVAYPASELLLTKHPFRDRKLHLQAHGICRETGLEGLSFSNVEEYLNLEFPGHSFPEEFARLIHARTEGHPLFMTDLVAELRDRKVIEESAEGWVLTSSVSEIVPHLPPRAESLIDLKLGALDSQDRRLLIAASIQGHTFDSAVISGALEIKQEEVEDRLENLDHVHGLVRLMQETELPDEQINRRYSFAHGLYQNAFYASLTPSRKQKLSAAVARSLLSCYANDGRPIAASLGVLFETARDFEKASEHFGIAAEKANRISAHAEAVEAARRGVRCLQRLPEGPQRDQRELQTLITLGGALMAVQGFGAAEIKETYSRAVALLDRPPQTQQNREDLLLTTQRGLWAYHLVRAEYLTATRLSRYMLGVAKKRGNHPLLVEAYHAIAFMLGHRGKFEAAVKYQKKALDLYNREPHPEYGFLFALDPSVGCRVEMALDLWILGYPDQALKQADDAQEVSASLGQPYSRGFALNYASVVHQMRGECDEALARAESAIALAREYRLREVQGWANSRRGWALAAKGQPEGIALMRDMLSAQRALGSEVARPHFLAAFCESLLSAGRVGEALEAAEEGLKVVAETGARYYKAELLRLKGECLLARNPDSAPAVESCYLEALGIAARQKARSWELRSTMSLAHLWISRGKREEALARLSPVVGWFTEGFTTADLRKAVQLLSALGAKPHSHPERRLQ